MVFRVLLAEPIRWHLVWQNPMLKSFSESHRLTYHCHCCSMCQKSYLDADADAKQRKIQKRLQTIKREERAIKAALESLDHQDDSEDEPGEPGHQESAKPPPDAQQEQQQQLQRATLTNRLQGLQAKREQLKVDPSVFSQVIVTGCTRFAPPDVIWSTAWAGVPVVCSTCTAFWIVTDWPPFVGR